MKRTMLMLCHAVFMTMASVLVAQELPAIIPPTPEAASLGKFTEIPISHYTGVPNISVPIASFSVGDKTFPVSISYHARGARVDETPSRVGLGWALNAGGQISRQVRHKADDGGTGYFNRFSTVYNSTFNNNGTASNLANCCVPLDTDDDKLPDLFTLQMGSLSAKFIFNYKDIDQNGNLRPILQKYDDIIVEAFGDFPITSFIVTDKEGYTYHFGTSQSSDQGLDNYVFQADGSYTTSPVDYLNGQQHLANAWRASPHTTTWHLSKIESPNGEAATFHYGTEISYVYRRSGDNYDLGEYTAAVMRSKIHEVQLQEIRFNYNQLQTAYDKIVFEATNPRQDMDNIDLTEAKELDAIKIYRRHNGGPFALHKTFNLYHSYMVSPSNLNYHQTLAVRDTGAAKRLVLDSIAEVGSGISKPPYVFSYDPTVLPNRHSNSQDYWGHYNGANNGQFLAGYGIDRRVDTTLSEAGMLKKITYPTGGSTRFTYEHNRGVLGDEYDGIWLPSINPAEQNAIGLSNIGLINNNYHAFGGVWGPYYSSAVFTLNSQSQFTYNINLPDWNSVDQNAACITNPLGTCNFRIRLVPMLNGLPDPNQQPIYIWTDSTPMFVSAGDYRLEVHVPNGWDPNAQASSGQFFNVALFWDDQVAGQDIVLYAAGKRIKQVEFLDSGDNVVYKKTYDYNNSGMILGLTDFSYILNVGGVEHVLNPYHLFNTYQGNTIGYKNVDEYFGDKANNSGKRSYEFLVTKDSGDFMVRPRTPPTDNEWLRGLPLQIIDYKNNGGGTYTKVKQVDNEYLVTNDAYTNVLPLPVSNTPPYNLQILPNNPILTPETYILNTDLIGSTEENLDIYYDGTRTNFRLPFVWWFAGNDLIDQVPGDRKIKIFHFTGGTLDTSKTMETLYDASGNATIVDSTTTAFNYAKHYQPEKVTSVTSDGIPLVQTFTYPQGIDIANRTAEEQDLVDQNRLVPIETMTFRDADADGVADNGEETSRSKTTFAWFPDIQTQDVLEPTLVQTGKDTDPSSVTLIDRIDFKDYDSDGNVLQVSRADGMDISYIYGYHNSLPVAKIENATYAQVSSHVANIQAKSDLDDDNCRDSGSCDEKNLRTALNALRSAFPDAMVTTYTYDPLVGITSMTDPKGYTVYYEYDGLNRLVRVKDADGNILSENKYHYLLDN